MLVIPLMLLISPNFPPICASNHFNPISQGAIRVVRRAEVTCQKPGSDPGFLAADPAQSTGLLCWRPLTHRRDADGKSWWGDLDR
jgi:hypothetical protein